MKNSEDVNKVVKQWNTNIGLKVNWRTLTLSYLDQNGSRTERWRMNLGISEKSEVSEQYPQITVVNKGGIFRVISIFWSRYGGREDKELGRYVGEEKEEKYEENNRFREFVPTWIQREDPRRTLESEW